MARTKNGEPLSVGAKSLVKEIAKQYVYGFVPEIIIEVECFFSRLRTTIIPFFERA